MPMQPTKPSMDVIAILRGHPAADKVSQAKLCINQVNLFQLSYVAVRKIGGGGLEWNEC